MVIGKDGVEPGSNVDGGGTVALEVCLTQTSAIAYLGNISDISSVGDKKSMTTLHIPSRARRVARLNRLHSWRQHMAKLRRRLFTPCLLKNSLTGPNVTPCTSIQAPSSDSKLAWPFIFPMHLILEPSRPLVSNIDSSRRASSLSPLFSSCP